jgi:hypothetical protein
MLDHDILEQYLIDGMSLFQDADISIPIIVKTKVHARGSIDNWEANSAKSRLGKTSVSPKFITISYNIKQKGKIRKTFDFKTGEVIGNAEYTGVMHYSDYLTKVRDKKLQQVLKVL